MLDIIRESALGQLIRLVTSNILLQYPEERPGFELPSAYEAELKQTEKPISRNDVIPASDTPQSNLSNGNGDALSLSNTRQDVCDVEALQTVKTTSTVYSLPFTQERLDAERQLDVEHTRSIPIVPQKTLDGIILVDWYTTDDPANPQNWSYLKKCFVILCLCIYTFTVYCAAPIFATSEPGIVSQFCVSLVASSLGLSLYVLAYGIGDLLFSPVTEIPVIGRNPVYYLTFIIYLALSSPTATANSFGGLLALRFWMGFFGSPALANGGATVGDMFALIYIPYGLSWWVLSAWLGPALGPVLGGFAAMAEGWRWPLWEVVWMASLVLVILLCLMPETSAQNILLRRAQRLCRLTGNPNFQSQSEIDQRSMISF